MFDFRFDRALSVGLIHPALRVLSGHSQHRVPILMYHSIGKGTAAAHPYFETSTSLERFRSQMQFLHDQGYTPVSLGEAIEAIRSDRSAQRLVALTFDDGYRDFYTQALPVLRSYGFTATLFVVSGFTRARHTRSGNKQFMTWSEIRKLPRLGIQIGSHTVNHPLLYGMTAREIEYEVSQSKKVIEDKIGEPVRSFSYPFAFPEHDQRFVRDVRELLEKHDYENGVSTIIGTAGPRHERFFLKRLPVNSHDDLRFFQAKLEGGYDWLHTPQRLYKARLKRSDSRGWRPTTRRATQSE